MGTWIPICPSTTYLTSLSHRRNEVFINKVSDINPVLRILINEALMRILEFDNGPSGLEFSRIDVAMLDIFFHNKPLINNEPVPLQSGKDGDNCQNGLEIQRV
jgi:hypothetical protein